jgi:phage terminase large subunit-like protein
VATWCQGQPDKIKERFEDITRAVRKGPHPQTISTSTPKNHPFFIWFEDNVKSGNKLFKLVQGSMLDNPTLSKDYIDGQIELYAHNARGRQEIYGDLITDTPGAYWIHEMIDSDRCDLPSPLSSRPLRNTIPNNDQLMGRVSMPIVELLHYIQINTPTF